MKSTLKQFVAIAIIVVACVVIVGQISRSVNYQERSNQCINQTYGNAAENASLDEKIDSMLQNKEDVNVALRQVQAGYQSKIRACMSQYRWY